MAVYEFYEIDGRSGEFNDEQAREYDRHYIARCNSKLDREPEIWQHPKCPKPRETISDWDRLSRCKSVTCTHVPKSRWTYKVQAKFSSLQFEQPKSDNPLNDPAEIDSDTELVSEERYTDRKGRPTTNTAGDLIRITVEIPRLTIRVQKNISLNNAWLSDIAGIVNSAAIRIDGKLYPAGTLKVLRAAVGKIEYRSEIAYRVAKLEIRHKKEGWESVSLNQGYNEIIDDETAVGANGKFLKKKVRARMGFYGTHGGDLEPEPNPVFLDKDGYRPRESFIGQFKQYPDPKFVTVNVNGKKLKVKAKGGIPKLILEPRDIVLLKFDILDLYDFNKLPLR